MKHQELKRPSEAAMGPCIACVIDTEGGHALVSSFELPPHLSTEQAAARPRSHTGHVWAEIESGMTVARIHWTPAEARRIAAMLIEVAEAVEARNV